MLSAIASKIKNRERLSRQDGCTLLASPDLLAAGRLGLQAKQRVSGDHVYFNRNCHLNLTNVCSARCGFCAFSCDPDDPRAYCMDCDQALERVQRALADGITEVHVVSGLHPQRPFSYYRQIIAALHRTFPQLHIKAFTAVEIQHFADISGMRVPDVLRSLMEAGLGSLPGGGAEVLSDRVRSQLCPRKASARQWLDVMRCAHELGLKSNATLLFGHIETDEEIIDHLLALRQLQDETHGFQTFIPLPFHPANTRLAHLSKPSAVEMLRIFAVSRLLLDNIPHIKAYWVQTGLTVAQMALLFGADDVDGTLTEERITHAAGAATEVGLSADRLIRLIQQAGMRPVQRDTLYRPLKHYPCNCGDAPCRHKE